MDMVMTGDIYVKKLGERASPITTTSNIDQVHSSSRPQVDRINLYFKLQEVILDGGLTGTPVFQSPIVTSVHIIHPQVITSESTYEAIETELRGWIISDNIIIERMVQKVISDTLLLLESVSPRNNILDVYVEVYVVQWDRLTVMRQSGSGMVPMIESTVEPLKRKIIMDIEEDGSCESCPICCKEFASGDEVVCTPCSHEFCGSCIEKWLTIRHNCPMCRYEIPTN